MSTPAADDRRVAGRDRVAAPSAVARFPAKLSPRIGALAGLALLTVSYLSTLYWITGVRGGRRSLLAGLALGLGAAILLRRQDERRVALLAVALAAGVGFWYVSTAGLDVGLGTITSILLDAVAMATGISVTDMAAAHVWAAAVVPLPAFLSTYLALRRRHVAAVLAGGWLVCFLALTGDATVTETLAGSIGAVALVGFGELDRRDASITSADLLVVLVALMAVVGVFAPIVPAGQSTTLTPAGGAVDAPGTGDAAGTTTGSLDEELLSGGSARPTGPNELSPEVRFVVEAEEAARWRVDVLDRYDGDGWYTIADERPYREPAREPPGDTRALEQNVELAVGSDSSLPTAATPVEVEGVDADVRLSETGSFRLGSPLEAGSTYTVRSEVPEAGPSELAAAGTDYPTSIEERYTQLPDDVPDRVAQRTETVAADADTPHETAVAVEQHLQETKNYSLDVTPPRDTTLADGFLFEMEAGYCTYFAGTMATMLRTQGIPARVAVGYGSGQWVEEDRSVVRGTDAHAWVEVYYPEIGWVEHDPTPAAQWEDVHGSEIRDARAAGVDGVDVEESQDQPIEFDPPTDDTSVDADDESDDRTGEVVEDDDVDPADEIPERNVEAGPVGDDTDSLFDDEGLTQDEMAADDRAEATDDGGDGDLPGTPTRLLDGVDDLLVAALLLLGAVAGVRRVGIGRGLGRAIAASWQRRRDPTTDAALAIERLEWLLARDHAARRLDETPREYLDRLPSTVDDRVAHAYELHERIRYGGDCDREAAADELVATVDELTRSRLPVVGRHWR